MAHVTQIRHFGIVVKNLDLALWFYKDVLGLEVQHRMVESGAVIDNVLALEGVEIETIKLGAQEGKTLVELLSYNSHRVSTVDGVRTLTAGPSHVAFTIRDLRSLYADLTALGIEFNCPPQVSRDGKVLLTYCKDPEGTLVELVEIL